MPRTPPESAAARATDRAPADFRAGTAEGGVHVAATSAGAEMILTPTLAAEFGGDGLPAGWFVEPWREGGHAELDGGALVMDGATTGYSGLFGSERSLEFVATFHKRPHQHVGFGTDFRNVPWITFSTKFGHSLYARTHFFIPEDSRLSPSLLGSPHRFRIDWHVLHVDFWVDGRLAAHQLVPVVGYMRPLASNGSLGGGPLSLEWLRMSPYRTEGTFTSRVHDAGEAALWTACEVDADVPAGTAVSVQVRGGDAAEPDVTWSGWTTLAGAQADGTALWGRFAQYRAVLATTDVARTPAVRAVALRYSPASGSSGPSSGPS